MTLLLLSVCLFLIVSNVRSYLHDTPNCSLLDHLSIHNNFLGDTLFLGLNFSNCPLATNTSRLLSIHSVVLDTNNQILAIVRDRQRIKLGGGYCHTPLRVILWVKLSLNESTQVVIVSPSSPPLILIHCNTSMGFDCVKTPLLGAIPYTMTNCLLCGDDDIHAPPKNTSLVDGPQEHSPLYWYLRCLDEDPLVNNDTVCGESMCVHLYRSGLYLDQCDANNVRVMPPWYRMVVHLVARRFNYGSAETYKDVWWLAGLELLERHCDLKDHGLSGEELEAPQSFFNSFLDHFKTHEESTENAIELLCGEIGRRFDDRYNETMGQMLFNQWYYKGFKFALPPNENMELRAIYLLSFLCVMPFILIVLILYALYRLRLWRSKYLRPSSI